MQIILIPCEKNLVLLFHKCMDCSQVQNQLWHQISQMVDRLVTLTRLIKGLLYMYQTFATNDSKMKPRLCLLDVNYQIMWAPIMFIYNLNLNVPIDNV